MISQKEWSNLLENLHLTVDGEKAVQPEISYPFTALDWREDGLFIQVVGPHGRIIFKLSQDEKWKVWGTSTTACAKLPKKLSEVEHVISQTPVKRVKLKTTMG